MAYMVQKIASMFQIQRHFKIIITVILFTSCADKKELLPYYKDASFTPYFYNNEEEAIQQVAHKIGTFSFLDQNGKIVSSQSLNGKIYIANFIFTSCGSICPTITSNLKSIETEYKDDPSFSMLSFSVTPWMDSVSVLKNYANNYGITANNWHFLTGQKEEIYTLARKSYFAEEDIGLSKSNNDFLHTEHIILVDKNKRIRGIYNGTEISEIKNLSHDISILLSEQ